MSATPAFCRTIAIAEVIATAEGFLGPCADYLINTVDHLAALGIHDRPLERLRAQVLAPRSAPDRPRQASASRCAGEPRHGRPANGWPSTTAPLGRDWADHRIGHWCGA